jgi:anthranilate phosphoribosyltransferase
MNTREAIDLIVSHRRSLTEDEAAGVMRDIMSGEATPAQIGAFLVALRLKGETVDEVAGMARVMRENALSVPVEGDDALVDTCGTGGSGTGSFNISTAAAFVAAAAGARVAKHGNRAMTSASGSADVLEALGAKIDLTPEQVAQCLREVGIGFMFAQAFHPAMKHVAGPRREIGVRTVFNVLGPLTNPAGARHQLLGVARAELAPLLAGALARLGSAHALVVHGHGGLDELSLSGPSNVTDLRDGALTDYTISPGDVGLQAAPNEAVLGGSPEENANSLRAVLDGRPGPLRDITLLNAAAALVAADLAPDIKDGVDLAARAVDSGAAREKLDAFVRLTGSFA